MIITAAVLAALIAAADPAPEIAAAYQQQCAALKLGDVDRLVGYMGPGYNETDPAGKQTNREDSIAQLKTSLAVAKMTNCSVKIVSVEKAGEAFSATVELTLQGVLNATNAPVKDISIQKDVWKRDAGAWQISSSAILENTLWMNGGIVQHDVAPSPAPPHSP